MMSRDAEVATRWSSAVWPGAPSDPTPTDPQWSGGTVYCDERSMSVDRLVGGVGRRLGRRHPDQLIVGETVDFWRVEPRSSG